MEKRNTIDLRNQNSPQLKKGILDFERSLHAVEAVCNGDDNPEGDNGGIKSVGLMLFLALKKEVESLKKLISEQNLLSKEILSFSEAAIYLGISESHLYRLTSKNKIRYYKPEGKKIYMLREDLDRFLLRNEQLSEEQQQERIDDFKIGRAGR